MTLDIREAVPGEEGLITAFIRKLAQYEEKLDEVTAREEDVAAALFGPTPRCHCALAFWNGEPAGFALWFYNFSSFEGKAGIYLEDLFVEAHLRGKGIGKALIKTLARRCVAEGLPRFQWWVLDWNQPAIEVYRAMGAKPMDEWTVFRVSGPELEELAR
ncbi:GNAT family N-acetyltransferase [Aestuariivirga sp.]|uniref:GNAT family N-acetyltransferase n=1 Tax=Aestuariivirga sp. TaxID=2650926 RepID=UPI003BABAA79